MPGEGGVRWSSLTLADGTRAILAPMEGRESVTVSLMVRVGSRWEPLRLAGVSHFLEHIVFKGTERYPTARAISEAVEGVGGVLNASTEKEMTTFWAKVPAERLGLALDVVTQLAFAPLIRPEEVDRERGVVIEELGMYLDQPGELVQMLFDRLMWGRHPLARDPAGTKASLGRVGAAELDGYRRTFYTRDRVVAVVAGGFQPDVARAELGRLLGGLPGARAGNARLSDGGVPEPAVPRPAVLARRRRGEQVHLTLGVRCPSYLDHERWKVDLVNCVLGEGMSSRLFLELRENQALAYEVHSYTARQRDSGDLSIYLATHPDQAVAAMSGALREARNLGERPVGREELDKAKAQIAGRLRLQLEGTSAMSEFLGHQALLTDGVLAPAEIIAAVEAVEPEELQDMARRLFCHQAWTVAAVGPGVGDEPLRAALDAGLDGV